MRRCQQFELYAAERNVDHGREFTSVDDVERWANTLREEWWWPRFYRDVHVVEVNRSRDRSASVGGWYPDEHLAVLAMLPVHLNEHDVLHELAHPLARSRFGSTSHDPFFARVLLELTYLVRGTAAWQELTASFDTAGIVVDETDEAELHRQRLLMLEVETRE